MSIEVTSLEFIYNRKSPLEHKALDGVDFAIEEGSFVAIVGRTGCGKSTLVQHLNALLTPSAGSVKIDDFLNTCNKKERSKNVKELRKKVGLVFQFPEYQLFEETVIKDVAFGPKNFGRKGEDALNDAKEALAAVGIGPEFYERSPFELSGGEKRRVAIAGILAIKPQYLVVDEPTAGLDPLGGKEIMDLFKKIHEAGTTVILVTHDMDIVLSYCQKAIVMDEGKIAKIAAPKDLFMEDLEQYSLETPAIFSFVRRLNEKGFSLEGENIYDVASLADALLAKRGKRK